MTKPRLITVFASSLDGRIALPAGGESHLGSYEDKQILNKSLSKVDATIFGSGTLKAHKSTYLIKNKSKNGNFEISNKQPISIVVGEPKNFSFEWTYFKQPIERWLIGSEDDCTHNKHFKKCIIFNKSWGNTLINLKKEGLNSIAILGGGKLIYSFFLENLIDEIQITIVPKIIGGKYTWIPPLDESKIFDLHQAWVIKSIESLSTNEVLINYIKKKA